MGGGAQVVSRALQGPAPGRPRPTDSPLVSPAAPPGSGSGYFTASGTSEHRWFAVRRHTHRPCTAGAYHSAIGARPHDGRSLDCSTTNTTPGASPTPNDYLDGQLFHAKGMSWGVKRIWRNEKTKEIVSEPYVYRNDERSVDLANQILERLKSKSTKKYPAGTVLIVNCDSDGLLLEDEWDKAIERVQEAQQHLAFREVFLVETGRGYSVTLYGKRTPQRRRRSD